MKGSSVPSELDALQGLLKKRYPDVPAFIVGGVLRDSFLGRHGRDIDLAVGSRAIPIARAFARRIKGAFVLLDAETGCARVAKKKADGIWTFDLADFRAKTLTLDLKGRDFTINTFAVPLSSVTSARMIAGPMLSDPRARKDLKARTIRMVSSRAFRDDPLRLLRAYSLMAQLGFRIDPATRKAIKAQARRIHDVSPERMREELFKILASGRAAPTLRAMQKDGFLFVLLPHLKVMHQVPQGGYHHLDVWAHTLETVGQLEALFCDCAGDAEIKDYLDEEISGGHSRRAVMVFAALLHDIGKPDTKKKEPGGRTSFHGHEHVGKSLARIMARQLLLSTRERHALEDLIALHLRPGYLSNFKKPSERMIFRFMRDAGEEAVAVLLLSLADQRATRGPLTTAQDVAHHEKICRSLIRAFFEKRKEAPFVRLIDGHDLIRTLKMTPGPVFSKVLRAVEEAQHLGKVTTKKGALEAARKAAGLKARRPS
ncbi:MAG: HD domain-containing protein [Elusimicrobia bacterium]|nr:HD domain-containing protein [Elusimicrobiota bacterium]